MTPVKVHADQPKEVNPDVQEMDGQQRVLSVVENHVNQIALMGVPNLQLNPLGDVEKVVAEAVRVTLIFLLQGVRVPCLMVLYVGVKVDVPDHVMEDVQVAVYNQSVPNHVIKVDAQ